MENIWHKIKEFCLKNEHKMVLVAAFCLISAVSYEFGTLQGQKWQQKPLLIEKPINIPAGQLSAQNEASQAPESVSNTVLPLKAGPTSCAYVGSKSSNKFYLPSCQWAKSIKPENIVCFQNAQQAISQGRTESKCAK